MSRQLEPYVKTINGMSLAGDGNIKLAVLPPVEDTDEGKALVVDENGKWKILGWELTNPVDFVE